MSAAASWILRSEPRGAARLRLFCFHYAGGAASSYRRWAAELPPQIEVCAIQLPGRGSRFHEAPCHRSSDVVPPVATALQPLLDLPFALVGHSLGALIAFELAREFRRRSWPMPARLAVSGREAPHVPDRHPPMAPLPDAEFLEEIRKRYDGVPDAVLAEKDLLQVVLPMLRADVHLLESYVYEEEPPLECGISCFGGEQDRYVAREGLEAWREQTRGPFRLRTFRGGHFFVESQRSAILRGLQEDLGPWTSDGQRERA